MAADGPYRILVTGASGLVGGSLVRFLRQQGHEVVALVRRAPQPGGGEIPWDPARGVAEPAALENADAVVHLAGENIAAGRWTPARKSAILRSRSEGTRLLCEALASRVSPPRVLVSASAIGYYGHRGDEQVDETSPAGVGFLSEVCQRWEEATAPARQAGLRVVNLRIGLVLSAAGGALARMLTPFKLGLGGRVGNGRQWMSWMALSDLTRCMEHLILSDAIQGPVNAVTPNPVTNGEFARTLGRVLRRPALLPMPARAVRLLLGEMGQALLLDGARVRPGSLVSSGFQFLHPDLESALRSELGLIPPA